MFNLQSDSNRSQYQNHKSRFSTKMSNLLKKMTKSVIPVALTIIMTRTTTIGEVFDSKNLIH